MTITTTTIDNPAAPSARPTAAAAGPPAGGFSLDDKAAPAVTDLLTPASIRLTKIRLSADQLAILQHGPQLDPAQQAAWAAGEARQATTRAYALVKDAQTGKVLGGVFPGVANVSSAGIADDPRLQQGSPAEQTKALVQDIQRAIGKAVTIQYFSPNDPNAPTFNTYGSLPRSTT
jgi:hypothetical protein